MNWKLIVVSSLALIGLVGRIGVDQSDGHRIPQAVLVPLAQQEADRLAAEDRRVLDRELASLQAQLLAVNYEGSQLDAAQTAAAVSSTGAVFSVVG